jgi:hypothetical protein
MEAMKGKMKLQQQEFVALRESHTQLEQKIQDIEDRRGKVLAIVLREVNRHSKQIWSFGKAIHRSHSDNPVHHESITSEGSHASCEVLQPLYQHLEHYNQDDPQAVVDMI